MGWSVAKSGPLSGSMSKNVRPFISPSRPYKEGIAILLGTHTTEHSLSTMNTFREDYNGRDRPWRPSDEIKEEWRRRRSDNTSLRNSQEEKRGKNIGRMDRPQHLVCVDDSKEAKRAVKFALKNVPSNHKLVLLNGSYQPHVGGYYEPTELSEERRQSIMKICKKKGVINPLCPHTPPQQR